MKVRNLKEQKAIIDKPDGRSIALKYHDAYMKNLEIQCIKTDHKPHSLDLYRKMLGERIFVTDYHEIIRDLATRKLPHHPEFDDRIWYEKLE